MSWKDRTRSEIRVFEIEILEMMQQLILSKARVVGTQHGVKDPITQSKKPSGSSIWILKSPGMLTRLAVGERQQLEKFGRVESINCLKKV